MKTRIGNAVGSNEDLLTSVERRKEVVRTRHAIIWTGYREQYKEGDEEADRGNDGKTTSKSELALNGTSRKAENCEEWRKLVVKSTVVPQRSARLRNR